MKSYLLVAIMLFSSSVSFSYAGLFWKGGKKKVKQELNKDQVDTKESIKKAPGWYTEKPKKKGYAYYAATEVAPDMQLAVEMASLGAGTMLSAQLKSDRALYQKLFKKLLNEEMMREYTSSVDQTAAAETYDYNLVKKKIIPQESGSGGEVFRAYVLIEYDKGAQEQKMLEEIERNKALYEKLAATEAFEEMSRKVEEYRERQKNSE